MSLWVTINTGPYLSLQQQSEMCKVKSEQSDYRSYDLKWLEDPPKYRLPIFFLLGFPQFFALFVANITKTTVLRLTAHCSFLLDQCYPDILYATLHC